MIPRRVLVAGATGYLGRFVAKEFKSRGYYVRALARSPHKLDDMRGELDEIVAAEVTDPKSINDVCDGMEVVFSSIGITKQKSKLTWKDVDFQGNKNLLDVARRTGVQKFIYVSVFNGPDLRHLEIVKAHEGFVDVLKASTMNYAVIRPTGFFSDMAEFFEMARRGRVYLVGSGEDRVNPIHGADLAVTCVDAVDGERQEIDVGGPEILTYREIAELAFRVQGKPVRISSLPVFAMRLVSSAIRVFSRHQGELLAFMTTAMTGDVVAPRTGQRKLEAYFHGLCGQ
ncbi:MAG: SDR family oxidoreductase [Gemmatimonadota bacterium]|nr:MAG: SDR family oxidoreductase [Gemmatimonadota bacterium]